MGEEEEEALPDHLRCKRTDGRQWRCNRRVMMNLKLCEVHYLQGRHRQNKRKVPESLKLQKKKRKELSSCSDAVTHGGEVDEHKEESVLKLGKLVRPKKKRKSAKPVKKLKLNLKNGDLQLELIRMVLKSEVQKVKKKRNKSLAEESDGKWCHDSSSDGVLLRDLPNGLMRISPALRFDNVASCSSHCYPKVGADSSVVTRRIVRSKNAEPMPLGMVQDSAHLRKKRECHWCLQSNLKNLLRCSSCREEFYCTDCINSRHLDNEEVMLACPVCRGICGCKSCSVIDVDQKRFFKGKSKAKKILDFHYLICLLLPLVKQMNENQAIELEIEAKIKGKKPSDIQIPHADIHFNEQCYCNHCKTPIMNFHRSCSSCSYKLCSSCYLHILNQTSHGSVHAHRRKYHTLLVRQKSFDGGDGAALGMPCPPAEFGGCGSGNLDLSRVFPLNWTKELETNAEEIFSCYELPEILNVSSDCLLCLETNQDISGMEQLQETAKREDSNDNFLYSPSRIEIVSGNLEHFQKHWGAGQPVIVRQVLHNACNLNWDPIFMFSTYLKNTATKSTSDQARDVLDWFEVEIGVKQLFAGSLRGPKRASMCHERLKLKGWISSHLFEEHFPSHYAQILHALPLPEYMHPASGTLNIAADVPKEISKPDLGPFVYISYGCGGNLLPDDFIANLRYDSYDMVNIMVHASDASVSTEQLDSMRELMIKHKEHDKEEHGEVSKGIDLHEKVTKISWFSAATNELLGVNVKEGRAFHEKESDSDTDTDAEVSKFFFGPTNGYRSSEKHTVDGGNGVTNGSCSGRQEHDDSSGAQWDIFRRQDVPQLLKYLRRHSAEFADPFGCKNYVIHPILDQHCFLDESHKMRLREEFSVEPWTFEQRVGEAVIVPAGCPYQIRNLKSCVNVVLDFISPESVTNCIKLVDEVRLLPEHHKAKKADTWEVNKMALYSVEKAVREIHELTRAR